MSDELIGAPVTHCEVNHEMRFAVVLYGGVSLAIYMNGIIQELYAMVRATAPSVTDPGVLHVADDNLTGAERVYRALGARASNGRLGTGDGIVHTRFVVDIVTGTSAGGINGVFLAKALANDQPIDALTGLWIEHGDIAQLLNDREAVAVTGMAAEQPPESLLSGQRMLYELARALDLVSESPEATQSPYADQIDLWVTTTDLRGRQEVIPTSDQPRLGQAREVDHRVHLHFQYDAGTPNAAGADANPVNMFKKEYDGALAFAARATSSFPGAFRPVRYDDLDEVRTVMNSRRGAPLPWFPSDSERVAALFPRYAGAADYTTRSFADGGYLDNQPVDLVLETLPKRSADLPVSRRVLFVDPNPGNDGAGAGPTDHARADLMQTLLKVMTLPRVETITQEVERIESLAGPLRMRKEIYDAVERGLRAHQNDLSTGTPPAPGAGYMTLRVNMTVDDLTDTIVRLVFPEAAGEPQAPDSRFVHRAVRAAAPNPIDPDVARQCYEFLAGLDLAYELRRVAFVLYRTGANPSSAPDASQRTLAQKLDLRRAQLAHDARDLRAGKGIDGDVTTLRDVLPKRFAAVRDELHRYDPGPDAPEVDAIRRLFAALTANLHLEEFRTAVQGDVGAAGATSSMRWRYFQEFDEQTLALRALVPGENDDIEVLRVSPNDATSLSRAVTGPKLAGTAFHHFGGFFDDNWRRNDIMWGRLDAAERLIDIVLEDEPADVRAEWIAEAHRAILDDLMRNADGTRNVAYARLLALISHDPAQAADPADAQFTGARVLERLKQHYHAPPPPDRETTLALMTRTSHVVDAISAGLATQPGPLQTLRNLLGSILRPAAQLGELVLDRGIMPWIKGRLVDLALYAGLLMIVLGAIIGGKPVVTFGWTVLLVAAGLKIAINVLRNWLHSNEHRWWWLPVAIVGVLLVAVGVEGLLLYGGPTRWVGLFALGLASGMVVAAVFHGRAAAQDNPARTTPIFVLAALIVLATAGLGITQLATNGSAKLCAQSSWERRLVNDLPSLSCPTHR